MPEYFFRFHNFQVYKDTRTFRKKLKLLSRQKFPKEENFVLRPQLWRALDSILLNIAEGSEKSTDINFGQHLNIALGSVNEVVSCLDCAFDDGYITKKLYNNIKKEAEYIARQLKAFSSKVRRENRRKL